MSFDEEARWAGLFALDHMRGGRLRTFYDAVKNAYQKGTEDAAVEAKLRKLIAHAAATVPFYKGYSPDASLQDLPIVNKDSFRADYNAFTSSLYLDGKGCRRMSTSGSTGTPLTILQDPEKILRNRADGMFMGAMAGYYVGMKMAFIRVWVHNVKENPLRLFAENMIMVDSSDLSDEAILKMLEDFRKKKVKCLLGYASALGEINRCMDRHGVNGRTFSISSIIPISESMPQPVRKRLAEQFGCPVQSWYSNEENGIMGVQLPGSEVYYIDSSSFHYEILKLDSDEPARDGELGRIVITDLNNYAFPIIRYDNGDLAVARHQKKNGRTRLYLTELYGRRSDTIYSADGRPLTPYVITNNLWDVPGVRQYRFIQEDRTEYLLELNADREKVDEAEILRRISPYFGEGASIRVVYVSEIPVLNSGKRKYIENRCPLYTGKS